jgi:hypothetical protein
VRSNKYRAEAAIVTPQGNLSRVAELNTYGQKIEGIRFDSLAEAEYYLELLKKLRSGLVVAIKLQPEFILKESFKKGNLSFRKIVYKADFEVTCPDGSKEIIDVKGRMTPVFRLKRKLFEDQYNELTLKLIRKVAPGVFEEFH